MLVKSAAPMAIYQSIEDVSHSVYTMANVTFMVDNFNLNNFRHFFYILLPSEVSYSSTDQVPDYVNQVCRRWSKKKPVNAAKKVCFKALPWFVVLMAVEWIVLRIEGKHDAYAFNDTVTSLSAGILRSLSK